MRRVAENTEDGGPSAGSATCGPAAEGRVKASGRRRAVALRDLAELAGVDASTVSRALNRSPLVSRARTEMIHRLAAQAGYRPLPLRSKRAHAIGVLIASSRPDRIGGVGEPFLERIAWLAQQALSKRRMHVNLECIVRNADAPALPSIVQQNRVDGVLLAGHMPAPLVAQIRDRSVPAVAINDSSERVGVSCVRSEPTGAIHQAILRLAAWGHRQFGLLMNDLELPTSRAKHGGYLAALRDISIAPEASWVVADLPDGLAGGREGVRELLRRGPIPSAVLCCNDWVALGALHELQLKGLRIPQDVSVMGHDDVSFCDRLEPMLTSIRRPEDVIVEKAVSLLLAEVEHGPAAPVDELVEAAMVWRDSTGPAPGRLAQQA